MINWLRSKRKLMIILGIIIVLAFIVGLIAFKPYELNQQFTPNPVRDYQEAVNRIEMIWKAKADHSELDPACGTVLMTHNSKVENAIVFFHGFTSCPIQFVELGQQFFDQGYNVHIPRLPLHVFINTKGTALKGISAEKLASFATETADIAQGFGDQIIIAGLSGGGSIATWLSQQRDDIDLAVPIAPFLGVKYVPRPLTRPVTNLILSIPDLFLWWNADKKMDNELIAPYSYKGYTTHALFENLRLGFVAERQAKQEKPAAGAILVITNANDQAVNYDVVVEFEDLWLKHGEKFLTTYQFDQTLSLPHDFITPTHPDGQPDQVYPKLIELITLNNN